MITTLSKRISRYLVANGADASEEEVLAYGAECFINELISDALLIIIGILTNHVLEVLVWSVSFCLLRVNVGGLHAASHGWCVAIGTLIGASSIIVSPFLLQHVIFASILTVVATITAMIIAPVRHKNKQHIQAKRKEIKRKVIAIASTECIAIVVFYFANPVIASYIASGLIMATILAVAGMIWNPR